MNDWTQEIADEVCLRISEGETLIAICKDIHMPRCVTVMGWSVHDKHDFRDPYMAARKMWADSQFDKLIEMINQDPREMGIFEKFGNNAIALMREKCTNLRWAISKANPAMYGDKLDLAHTGEVTKRIFVVDSFDHVRFKDANGKIPGAN